MVTSAILMIGTPMVPEDKKIKLGLNNAKRNLKFLKRHPSEVLWMLAWETWHWCWR